MKEVGVTEWIEEMKEKEDLADLLVKEFNDEKHYIFYLRTVAILPYDLVAKIMKEVKMKGSNNPKEEFKSNIECLASKQGIKI